MIEKQAVQLARSITPKYPLGYTEVYTMTLSYLKECSQLGINYNADELDARVRNHCKRGV